MTQPSAPTEPPEPSAARLILRGLLILIGAFVSAGFILLLHFPAGH